jgi:hypothetical protein
MRIIERVWPPARVCFHAVIYFVHPSEGCVTDSCVAVQSSDMPMCLCTSIDATSINASLAKLGIQDYFSAFVTAEDDVETRAQM